MNKVMYLAIAMLLIGLALSGCVSNDPPSINITGAVAINDYYSPASPTGTRSEYKAALKVRNDDASDVSFDLVGVMIAVGTKGIPVSAVVNVGPEKKWVIHPGATQEISVSTGDDTYLALDMAREGGIETLALYIVLYNNGQYINGEYISPLPLLRNLPKDGSGYPLSFELKVPGTPEYKASMAEMYSIYKGFGAGQAQPSVPEPDVVEPPLKVSGFLILMPKPESGYAYHVSMVVENIRKETIRFDNVAIQFAGDAHTIYAKQPPPDGQKYWELKPGNITSLYFTTNDYDVNQLWITKGEQNVLELSVGFLSNNEFLQNGIYVMTLSYTDPKPWVTASYPLEMTVPKTAIRWRQ